MKELLEFIEPLQNLDKVQWGGGKQSDGTFQFPFPLYPFEIQKFEEVFFNSSLVDRNYGDRMNEKNWWNEQTMENDIPSMSENDVGTCITAIFRRERFCDGTIQHFLENGIIIKLLDRLKNIKTLS